VNGRCLVVPVGRGVVQDRLALMHRSVIREAARHVPDRVRARRSRPSARVRGTLVCCLRLLDGNASAFVSGDSHGNPII
jgi:hypothetical protein